MCLVHRRTIQSVRPCIIVKIVIFINSSDPPHSTPYPSLPSMHGRHRPYILFYFYYHSEKLVAARYELRWVSASKYGPEDPVVHSRCLLTLSCTEYGVQRGSILLYFSARWWIGVHLKGSAVNRIVSHILVNFATHMKIHSYQLGSSEWQTELLGLSALYSVSKN